MIINFLIKTLLNKMLNINFKIFYNIKRKVIISFIYIISIKLLKNNFFFKKIFKLILMLLLFK